MKKIILLFLLVVFATSPVACSNSDNTKTEDRVGVYPYELSEREEGLLRAFDLSGNSQIISFRAPSKAISLHVNIYTLDENAKWNAISGGAISIGVDREPLDGLVGIFAMQVHPDYSMDFSITCGAMGLYTMEPIASNVQITASTKVFLTYFQEIELNKEIPVALMVYDSGTSIRAYSLADYFEPTRFSEMDLVQVVTLTFLDSDISFSPACYLNCH